MPPLKKIPDTKLDDDSSPFGNTPDRQHQFEPDPDLFGEDPNAQRQFKPDADPVEAAEYLFIEKFQEIMASKPLIDAAVQRRKVAQTATKDYTLSELEENHCFDPKGNLNQDNKIPIEISRSNAQAEGSRCQTDKEKIVLDSVIFTAATEVGEAFEPEINQLTQDLAKNPRDMTAKMAEIHSLNNIHEHSDGVKDFIKNFDIQDALQKHAPEPEAGDTSPAP